MSCKLLNALLFSHRRLHLTTRPPLLHFRHPFSQTPCHHKYRCWSPLLARTRRKDAASRILQRVSYYISVRQPEAAVKYFHGAASSEQLELHDLRPQTFEAVLDLFLRSDCMKEAQSVRTRMENEGMVLSQPLRARVLATDFVALKRLDRVAFRRALRGLLYNAGPERFKDDDLLELLYHLQRMRAGVDVMEMVTKLYIHSRNRAITGADNLAKDDVKDSATSGASEIQTMYYLTPSCVAFMISRHVEAANLENARRWLDYHSRSVQARGTKEGCNSGRTPTFDIQEDENVLPYMAYVQGQLASGAEDIDPQKIFGTVLDRMQRDGIAPDTMLINLILQAEVERGAVESAWRIYHMLRTDPVARAKALVEAQPSTKRKTQGRKNKWKMKAHPNDQTFATLFGAAEQLAGLPFDPSVPVLKFTARTLFREMLEHEKQARRLRYLVSQPNAPPVAPAPPPSTVTQDSLGAALFHMLTVRDYAGAYVALEAYGAFHVPVDTRALDAVTHGLLQRCMADLHSSMLSASMVPPPASELHGEPCSAGRRERTDTDEHDARLLWVYTFLDLGSLGSLALARLRLEPLRVRQRMLNVARAMLATEVREDKQEGIGLELDADEVHDSESGRDIEGEGLNTDGKPEHGSDSTVGVPPRTRVLPDRPTRKLLLETIVLHALYSSLLAERVESGAMSLGSGSGAAEDEDEEMRGQMRAVKRAIAQARREMKPRLRREEGIEGISGQ